MKAETAQRLADRRTENKGERRARRWGSWLGMLALHSRVCQGAVVQGRSHKSTASSHFQSGQFLHA